MHTIEIVSDVSCPWCVIGYRALKSAIDELDMSDSIQISWKPFELNPSMPPEGQDRTEHIRQKYGLSAAQAQANRHSLEARGRAEGYEFNFVEGGRVYNTFKAHRLIHWSKEHDLQTELKLALFDLYFQQAGNPSDDEALLSCVSAVGLPLDQATQLLNSNELEQDVRRDQQQSQQQGISAVPAFIFNNTYLVSGGQPKDSFIGVLQALEKETRA